MSVASTPSKMQHFGVDVRNRVRVRVGIRGRGRVGGRVRCRCFVVTGRYKVRMCVQQRCGRRR